jgi:hypothetical protein
VKFRIAAFWVVTQWNSGYWPMSNFILLILILVYTVRLARKSESEQGVSADTLKTLSGHRIQ